MPSRLARRGAIASSRPAAGGGGVGTIAATLLTSAYDPTNDASPDTASVAPAADSLLLLFTFLSAGSTAAPSGAASGLGLTWIEHHDQPYSGGAGVRRLQCFTAQCGSSPGSGVITLTLTDEGGGATSTGSAWAVIQITGHDPANPIRQAEGVAIDNVNTASINLAAPADPASRPFSAWGIRVEQAATPRANWTELCDHSGGSPSTGFEVQWREDAFDTTASVSWASADDCGGIAVEIAASGT